MLKSFPVTNGRRFNPAQYQQVTCSGEKQPRKWLLYSESTDSLFCFPCCIFSATTTCTSWTNFGGRKTGFRTFGNQSTAINEHEQSNHHYKAVILWKNFIKQFESNQLIDNRIRKVHEQETSFWRDVLQSMIDAVLFLAKNNLAFRGSSEKIGMPNCGNFLSLIELLSRYHPPLALHIERLKKGSVSYLSPQVQNEFISLTAQTVRSNIVLRIKERKYYSILFDATPDCSHNEQISQVLRTVKVSNEGCQVEENFIDFLHFDEKRSPNQ